MKYIALILIILTLFFSSCIEEQEIYPRPIETIFINVDHDTIITIFDNQTYILIAETGDSTSIYSWNCNDWLIQNTSQITVNYPGDFEVDITTNMVNQHYSVTLIFSESPMYFPSSFTPNNDGMNDCWSPHGYNIDMDEYLLKIYDTYDHLLYKTDLVNGSWNGGIEGELCPSGYYYYVVRYKTLNGEKYKVSGMIQLIR